MHEDIEHYLDENFSSLKLLSAGNSARKRMRPSYSTGTNDLPISPKGSEVDGSLYKRFHQMKTKLGNNNSLSVEEALVIKDILLIDDKTYTSLKFTKEDTVTMYNDSIFKTSNLTDHENQVFHDSQELVEKKAFVLIFLADK